MMHMRREMYEKLTIKILEGRSYNILPFQMKVMKQNRKESGDTMLRLQQGELLTRGIRKEVDIINDDGLDNIM
jgi:hypothetical protein